VRNKVYAPWRCLGFQPACASGPRGFTLLELLVALVLFAVLSLLTYSSLRAMIDSNRQISLEGERLATVQMAMARLALDVQQAQARGIRDEYGNRQPAMIYGALPAAGFEFTRGGRSGSTPGRANGNLQRLRYLLDGQELIRESWSSLDREIRPTTFRQTVLDRVTDFEVRFLDEHGLWHSHWPPLAPGGADSLSEERLPAAVEVWVELEDWGRLRRLFPLPPGYGP